MLHAPQFLPDSGDSFVTGQHLQPDGLEFRVQSSLLGSLACFLRVELRQVGLHRRLAREQRTAVQNEQPDLQRLGFLLKVLVGTSLPGLTFQRVQLPTHFDDDVADPEQVLARRFKLAERLGLLLLVPHDAGGLLDELAAILRRGVQDLFDAALLNDRVPLASRSGIEEQASNILQPAGRLVDEILAVAVSIEPPRDHHLVIFAELIGQGVKSHESFLSDPADDQ